MNIGQNMLFRFIDSEEIHRVILINNVEKKLYLYDCTASEKCFPMLFEIDSIVQKIKVKSILILDEDPYDINLEENQLSIKEKELREKAWNAIKDIAATEDILDPVLRNILVKTTMRKHGVSRPSVYTWLRKYWKHALNANALLPYYENCGAPGKERKSSINDKQRKAVKAQYKELIGKGMTLRDATRHFNRKIVAKNKKSYVRLKPHSFWYHGTKDLTNKEKAIIRHKEKCYNNDLRMLTGKSLDLVTGPCQIYQIDPSPSDIKIVSSVDGRFIGRAYFYIIRDVFTKAYFVFVTLHNPSYISACQALFHAFLPRHILQKQLGLEDFPIGKSCHSLCEYLVADRQEILGPKSDQIAKAFDMTIGNTTAYNPAFKGDVERAIRMIHDRLKSLFIGKGQINKESNSNEEACFTFLQLSQVCFMVEDELNNHHVLKDHSLNMEMIQDKVEKIPMKIHQWCQDNTNFQERYCNEKKLWLNLMERKQITPNRKGIKLNGYHYVPQNETDHSIMEQLILANKKRPIEIVYDPRNYRQIYWVLDNRLAPLRLRGKHDPQFLNEWEAVYTLEDYKVIDAEGIEREELIKERNDDYLESSILVPQFEHKDPNLKNTKLARAIEKEIEVHEYIPNPAVLGQSKDKVDALRKKQRLNKQLPLAKLIENLND